MVYGTECIERFGHTKSDIITLLKVYRYTRKDTTEKKDAIAYNQDIMRITKVLEWNSEDGFINAFYHFEPGLKRDLDPPNTGLTEFIKQMQLRQSAWHTVFSKPRPPDPPLRSH